jgi:hypothetical protein
MKQFKGYTEGTQFKGVMKFQDIIEMQNKAVIAIDTLDATIAIHSGMNVSITDSGILITDGILLWGGFPASYSGGAIYSIEGKKYYVVTVVSQEQREVNFVDTQLSYFAYDNYQVDVVETYYELGTYYQGREVVACLPFFMRVGDCETTLVMNNGISGEDGDIVEYNSRNAVVLTAGDDKYLLTKGVIFGDSDVAERLGGILIGNLVQFGELISVGTSSISLNDLVDRQDVEKSGTLINILSQIRKNVNDLKQVAYTSDYNDLENKLTEAGELLLSLNQVLFTQVPNNGTVRYLVSQIAAAVNSLQEIAFTSRYNDLQQAPFKLSEITNDLTIPDDAPIGEIKFIASSGVIPPGWVKADGTNGTIDMSPFLENYQVLTYTEFSNLESGVFTCTDGPFMVLVAGLQAIQKIALGKSTLTINNTDGLGTVGTTALCGNKSASIVRTTGSSVNIYALGDGHNRFKCWNQGLDTEVVNNPLIVTIDNNITYTAYFDKIILVTVNVSSPSGIGSVSLDGYDWQQTLSFETQTGNVSLYAKEPSEDYSFNGFYINGVRQEASFSGGVWELQLTDLEEDTDIVAEYSERPSLNIDINPNGAGEIQVSAQPPYSVGQEVQITAVPKGYNQFINFEWMDGEMKESSSNPMNYTIRNGVNDINANFQVIYQQIIRTEDNTELRGTIKVDDGSQEAVQTVLKNDGEDVQIEAVPANGWNFSRWISTTRTPLSYEAKTTYKVQANEDVVAQFTRVYLNVDVSSEDESFGTVTGAGSYEYDSEVTVSAVPLEGYSFAEWVKVDQEGQEEQMSTQLEYTFNVTENIRLVAKFELIQYNIDLQAEPSEYGSVQGGGTYEFGATVNLVANPYTNYQFVGWYENNIRISTLMSYSFVVTRDVALEARFAEILNTIQLTSSPGGAGVLQGAGQFPQGNNRAVIATPIEGYRFLGWYEGNSLLSSNSTYQFILVRDISLVAKFEMIIVELETSVNNELYGTVSNGGSFTYGQIVTLQATPRAGYQFDRWVIVSTGETLSADNPYLLKLLASMEVQAVFSPVTYQITATSSNRSHGTATGSGTYEYNTVVTLRAIAASGYVFVGWYENGALVSNQENYQFTVTGARSLVAQFEAE